MRWVYDDSATFRLLVYELHPPDTRASKLLAPTDLWYVAESAANTESASALNGSVPAADPRVAELSTVLQD